MKKAIPKIKARIVDKNNPWWTDNLQAERKRINKLYRTSKRKPSEANINRYKIAQREYAKRCDKTKNSSWNDYKEKIDSLEAINKFRKIIERHIKIRIGVLQIPDGTLTDPGPDTISYLLSTHFPTATPIKKNKI